MHLLHKIIKEASPSIAPEESLLYELDKVIAETEISGRQKKPSSRHYKPSSLNCLRMMWFYKKGAEKDKIQTRTSAEVGVLESGTDRHLRIQNWLLKLTEKKDNWKYWDVSEYVNKFKPKGVIVKHKFGNETLCYNEIYDLSFMCDGLLEYKGKFYILEIKTENAFKWFKRKSADEKHLYQGTCYSLSFGIDEVIYLYECRDDCKKKAFLVKIDKAKKEKLISQIENCEYYLYKNKVPSVKKELSICKWCEYQTVCEKYK